MVTLKQFMSSAGYIAFADLSGRKCMARFYPHLRSNSGLLRIYDFNTLVLLNKLFTKDFGAMHFYETVCADPGGALKFVVPEAEGESVMLEKG